MIAALAFLLALQEPVVIRTVEAPTVEALSSVEVAEGEIGVSLGGAPEAAEAAGFAAAPFVRGKTAFVIDPKAVPGSGLVVWISSLPREQTAAVLRETKGITLCIVSGRGGGDPEPLKIGDAWMVQAPGDARLWGRIEIRGGTVTNRFSAPEGRPSERTAAARKKAGLPADPSRGVLVPGRPPVRVPVVRAEPTPPADALETSNRACRLKIRAVSERSAYGSRAAATGRRFLVLDAEFENTIPMTLVQSNQVPTMYKIKELGDHLYLVVNGTRVSRIVPDGSRLPGHVGTAGFTIDRLGSRVRGNIVFEIPAEKADTIDLRFYDYAHGHMALTLREGPRAEAKPLAPLQENEVLEGGIFKAERLREAAGRKAPEGMTFLAVEVRARSRMSTESDATAFDPKAKPGDKIQVGTVSDWTDARRHLHVLIDGRYSYDSSDPFEFGEAPRFLPDLHTGGAALFVVPEKAESLEVRCDFPNARLPDGTVVHPKALSFLLEGKRPGPAATPALVEIDDDVFKVSVTGQSIAAEFAGVKAPAGATFLILDVTVTGAGTAGEMFQTADQLHYATEKGAQLAMHEAAFKGPRAPAKLLLVPTGERRSFQAVFAVPAADRKPRLAYRGVTKAATVALKPIEAARACPKCKRAAEAAEKFCGECGTKLDP